MASSARASSGLVAAAVAATTLSMAAAIHPMRMPAQLPAAATYTNPVTTADDPDPGVMYDPATKLYWAATTSGDAKQAYPLRTSSDLATWTTKGFVFPDGYPVSAECGKAADTRWQGISPPANDCVA